MSTTTYDTRLYPPLLTCLLVALLGASFGLIFVPVNSAIAVMVAVVGAMVATGILLATSPRIRVRDGVLWAGPAHIPVHFFTDMQALDKQQLREIMGPNSDERAWVLHRPWARTAVYLPLNDPRDPTPYWLVCTKDPHRLMQALRSARRD